MAGCDPRDPAGRGYYEDFGGASGKARPVNVSEKAVSVSAAELIVAFENDGRRNLVIQNIGANPVQVYTTNGLPWLAGGLIIAGQDLAASPPQIGGVWSAFQDGVGLRQGNIYVKCGPDLTSKVSVTEET